MKYYRIYLYGENTYHEAIKVAENNAELLKDLIDYLKMLALGGEEFTEIRIFDITNARGKFIGSELAYIGLFIKDLLH